MPPNRDVAVYKPLTLNGWYPRHSGTLQQDKSTTAMAEFRSDANSNRQLVGQSRLSAYAANRAVMRR